MDLHIDLNVVFSWIGKIFCGGLCLFVVGYPIVMIFAFAGPPDVSGWFRNRRRRRKPPEQQLDDGSRAT